MNKTNLRSKAALCRAVIEQCESRRLLSAGDLDPAFGGGDGIVLQPSDATHSITTVAVQSTGKIVAIGHNDSLPHSFRVFRLDTDGSLDKTFGVNGVATADFGDAYTTEKSILVVAGDRIVVVGTTQHRANVVSDRDFALARFTADGKLDSDFGGGDGMVTTDFGGRDEAGAVAYDSGKLVVAGLSYRAARYEFDGSLDNSFSGDGKFIPPTALNGTALGVSFVPNGGVVIGGDGLLNNHLGTYFVRLTIHGDLDTTFTRGSKFFDGYHLSGFTVGSNYKVLALGGNGSGGVSFLRLNKDAGRDATYGPSGLRTLVTSPVGTVIDTLFTADGKIYVSGETVARVTVDGTLDAGFHVTPLSVPGVIELEALAQTPDGRVVAGGSAQDRVTYPMMTKRGRPAA